MLPASLLDVRRGEPGWAEREAWFVARGIGRNWSARVRVEEVSRDAHGLPPVPDPRQMLASEAAGQMPTAAGPFPARGRRGRR